MEIDKIIITNLPAFYKINLFNRIAEKKRIFVVFTGRTSEFRNDDFFKKELIKFDYIDLKSKSSLESHLFLLKLLYKTNYKELILGGWDESLLWMATFLSPKKKNSVIVESSIYESKTKGFKAAIKKIILKKVNCAYASGKSQIELLKVLGFKGVIKKTKGVGLFNLKKQPPFEERESVLNFLYVGRLSPEKNLIKLIEVFNSLPYLKLNIVGFGPLEKYLKSIAFSNVVFHGAVNNDDIYKYYNKFDVFILPSLIEPWGLVVEEAFNNGMPVIVSDRVGCSDELVRDRINGLIFNLDTDNSLHNKVLEVLDIDLYNSLRMNISTMNFNNISSDQVKVYLS